MPFNYVREAWGEPGGALTRERDDPFVRATREAWVATTSFEPAPRPLIFVARHNGRTLELESTVEPGTPTIVDVVDSLRSLTTGSGSR
jgi:hypothetical protein